ncbi:hypothetical protein GGR21_000220 [Dysgonomonas hofstadii]|uniref:Uncharacterized protein n=1 Tax=Dysgonomonas hofstadii TaxID=637886 RepID=A0A840CMV9_9BACT|nr:hypothetical protein [Dysgonomonas hofstadii]
MRNTNLPDYCMETNKQKKLHLVDTDCKILFLILYRMSVFDSIKISLNMCR